MDALNLYFLFAIDNSVYKQCI